jgi:pyruvate dehydrogenase E1 component
MAAMPDGAAEGVLKGLYKLRPASAKSKTSKVHLFGSGPILIHTLRAQELLAEHFGVAADVWSATSYRELRRDALEVERWNLFHPTEKPRQSYLQTVLPKEEGIYLAASDFMRSVPEQRHPHRAATTFRGGRRNDRRRGFGAVVAEGRPQAGRRATGDAEI